MNTTKWPDIRKPVDDSPKEVYVYYYEPDRCYVAACPYLPGAMADGPTIAAAVAELAVAVKLWIETAIADGREVPEPPVFASESPEAIAHLQRQARDYLRNKRRPS